MRHAKVERSRGMDGTRERYAAAMVTRENLDVEPGEESPFIRARPVAGSHANDWILRIAAMQAEVAIAYKHLHRRTLAVGARVDD